MYRVGFEGFRGLGFRASGVEFGGVWGFSFIGFSGFGMSGFTGFPKHRGSPFNSSYSDTGV